MVLTKKRGNLPGVLLGKLVIQEEMKRDVVNRESEIGIGGDGVKSTFQTRIARLL